MQQLLNSINELDRNVVYLQSRLDDNVKRKHQLEENIKAETELKDTYTKGAALFKETSLNCQQQTNERISNIITKLYQFVFENKDRVIIQTDIKRNVPVASILIETERNGEKITLDPVEEEGGGKLDIISLGLRLAGLLLYTPTLNRVLILDEPLKNLSTNETSAKAYRQRTAEFLKMICEEYGIQIIMTTHDKAFVDIADRKFVVELGEDNYATVSNGE